MAKEEAPKLSGPSASLPHPSTPLYPTDPGAVLMALYQEGRVCKARAVGSPKARCANGEVSGTCVTLGGTSGQEHLLASRDPADSRVSAEAPWAARDLGLPLPPQPA